MTETVLNVAQPQKIAQPHIEVEHLNLWYGEKQALMNISMQIPKNSVTALIGPSGWGKSTFIRCLYRMNDLIKNCIVETTLGSSALWRDASDRLRSPAFSSSSGQQQRLWLPTPLALKPSNV